METFRLSCPRGELSKVQRQQAQHIDDGRAADEIQRACRVAGLAPRKQAEAPAVDNGCGDRERRASQERTTRNHWVNGKNQCSIETLAALETAPNRSNRPALCSGFGIPNCAILDSITLDEAHEKGSALVTSAGGFSGSGPKRRN